jgi:hypothetical protein
LLGKGFFVGFWFSDNVKLDFITAKWVENFGSSYGVNEFLSRPKIMKNEIKSKVRNA